MGQALYRKYRSKSLSEVVGQEHVTKTLQQALKQQHISHAYLFTGPRGVGKTSVARILAHEINDIAYTDDSTHIDIIEIDAASNRRIDEIRELRDKVHIAPTSAKYKVYIIDEVHMLTREAFNALLKTLEEPPEHVIFILATTDAHKLPDTIVSRTQRFHFKPAEPADLSALLQKIAKEEKITISPGAVALLAEHSDGSFRDSLSLLDQARSHSDSIDEKTIQQLLGLPPDGAVQSLMASVNNGDPSSVVHSLTELYDQGFQATTIAKQLGQFIRADIVASHGDNQEEKLDLLSKLIDVAPAYDPERFLEIILLQATSTRNIHPVESVKADDMEVAVEIEPEQVIVEQPEEHLELEEPIPDSPVKAPVSTPAVKTKKPTNNEELWPALLEVLKKKHNTIYGIVRMAEPSFESENTLRLTFAFAFHQKRLSQAENRQLLLDAIEELTGRQMIIECLLDTKGNKKSQSAPKAPLLPSNDSLSSINNIFSGAELLES
jgi:DNA polymerase-3 subunit gamma/tau